MNLYGFVANDGVNSIDLLGMIVHVLYWRCENNKNEGRLTLLDVGDGEKNQDGDYVVNKIVGDTSFFSGLHPWQHKAIPDGNYAILEHPKDGFFRLEPIDDVWGDDKHEPTGRTEFRLHYHGGSSGCITAKNPDNKEWDQIKAALDSTQTKTAWVKSKSELDIDGVEELKLYGYLLVSTDKCQKSCICEEE